jgi:outer membrane protein
MNTSRVLGAVVGGALAALSVVAVPAHAVQKGDWLVRAGVAQVNPNDSSDAFSGVAGGKVSVGDDAQFAFNLTYMLTDRVGVELLGALPFKHEIKGEGTLSAAGKLGETRQLPPTVTVQYHFSPSASVRPYVGAGLNYTTFFDEDTKGAIAGTDLSLSDSIGLALEAGVDIDITKSTFFNVAAWYIDIETEAKVSGGIGKADVTIDPLVLFMGLGWRF